MAAGENEKGEGKTREITQKTGKKRGGGVIKMQNIYPCFLKNVFQNVRNQIQIKPPISY